MRENQRTVLIADIVLIRLNLNNPLDRMKNALYTAIEVCFIIKIRQTRKENSDDCERGNDQLTENFKAGTLL